MLSPSGEVFKGWECGKCDGGIAQLRALGLGLHGAGEWLMAGNAEFWELRFSGFQFQML